MHAQCTYAYVIIDSEHVSSVEQALLAPGSKGQQVHLTQGQICMTDTAGASC